MTLHMRRAGLLAAVIAAALAVWISVDRSGARDRADARPGVELPLPAAPEPPLPPDEPDVAVEAAPPSGPVAVRGKVLFLESGRVPATFTAWLSPTDREGDDVEVSGSEGRFDVELPAGRYAVLGVEADGEEIDTWQDVVVDGRGEIEIRIVEAHEVAVVVIDARDRKPLADVLVYENKDDWQWHDFEPGDRVPGPKTVSKEPRRTDSDGRLPLGRGRGSVELYFRAEGYAWRAAEVAYGAGGEVVVELESGGDARLLIPRFAELRAPQIWMRRLFSSDESRLAPPAGTEELLVSGLVADDYEFTICRGDRYDEARVYGTTTGSIRAGKTATITIEVTPDPAPVLVKVTGTITVGAGWKAPPDWIKFEGAEPSNAEIDETIIVAEHVQAVADAEGFARRSGEDPRLVRFETRALPIGRYLVEIEPYLWARYVTVTDRSSHFDFALPQPVTIRVRLADAQGNDLGLPADVTWYVPMEERSGWSSNTAVREGDAFVLQAPPGKVTIRAEAPGYLAKQDRFEIPEDRVVTLALERAGAVIVRLRIDGKPFDGAGVSIEIRMPSGGGQLRGFDAGAARFDGLEPGRGTVALGEVAGCEAVEPIDIEVAAGQTRDLWIDLKRKLR
jgi:hypothetical protein